MAPFAVQSGTPTERIALIPNGIPVGDEYDFEIEDAPISSGSADGYVSWMQG